MQTIREQVEYRERTGQPTRAHEYSRFKGAGVNFGLQGIVPTVYAVVSRSNWCSGLKAGDQFFPRAHSGINPGFESTEELVHRAALALGVSEPFYLQYQDTPFV